MIIIQDYNYTLETKTYYFPRKFDSRFKSFLSNILCKLILTPTVFTQSYSNTIAEAQSVVDTVRRSKIAQDIEYKNAKVQEENSNHKSGLVEVYTEVLFVTDVITNERYAKDASVSDCLKYLTCSQFCKEFGDFLT